MAYRQSDLFSYLRPRDGPTTSAEETAARETSDASATATGRAPLFVDLFCGLGGASTGAMDAGYQVVLAVDACPAALATHAINHPECKHIRATLPLPEGSEPLPFPSASARWHLHGSPPCQKLSQANRLEYEAKEEEFAESMCLVRWFLDTALASSATTWSMEQVPNVELLALLDEYKRRDRARVDFDVFNFKNLGVPQKRRRLIAGSPEVVARLRRSHPRRKSIADVVESPRGSHIRNCTSNMSTKRDRDGNKYFVRAKKYELCAPVTGPSHTIIAHSALRWATPSLGEDHPFVRLTARESASIQGFPLDYDIGDVGDDGRQTERAAMRGVGNAVPPAVIEQALWERPVSPSIRWRAPKKRLVREQEPRSI